MKRTAVTTRLAVVVPMMVLTACLTPAEERMLDTALDCDDCQHERDLVASIGWRAVPYLERALLGPSSTAESNLEIQFGRAYELAVPGGTDPDPYVATHLSNYRATYQRRAALFLGDIADDCPIRACQDQIRQLLATVEADSLGLDSSGRRLFRQDVIQTIRRQRAKADSVFLMTP